MFKAIIQEQMVVILIILMVLNYSIEEVIIQAQILIGLVFDLAIIPSY